MRKSIWLAVIAALLLAALGAGVWWYVKVPHNAVQQLAYAKELESVVRAAAATKQPAALEPELRGTIEAYERVESKWGKSATAAEAWQHIVKLDEEIAKKPVDTLMALEHLVKEYPDEAVGGQALLEEAKVIRGQAEVLKSQDAVAAGKKFEEAIARLEDYRKKYEKGPGADEALMEIGRIWQDGIGEPLIKAIETFEKFLADYAASPYRPEALYRLAELMDRAKEDQRALALYSELLDKYPKNKPWAERALAARGRMLADKMGKPKEAAEDFQKLQERFPDSPLKDEARGGEQSARQQEAQKQSEEYGKGRYGGRMPVDTLMDKALPPEALFRQFAEQKLDAQSYDLDVALAPAEHRLSVSGSLKLINRGDDKHELLLMLSRGFTVTKVGVDGQSADSEQSGDALKITLPAVLKKDGETTITFTYGGRFAAPVPGLTELMKKMGGGSATQPATAPATQEAGAPATRPEAMASTGPTSVPATQPEETFNPQLALGDFGYGLSGGSWYPITILGDVFTARMRFTIPAGNEVVANGAMEKRTPGVGNATGELPRLKGEGTPAEFVFETKRPVFGLYFCYGNYVVSEKQVGKIHYYTYLRQANVSKSDAYIATAANILDYYSTRFGDFPYEKLALIECPLPPLLGGVGPASMMILHQSMVAQPEVPSTLLAHELAHQWFGNLIPINITDPGYNQWLSEGFATYADALYTEKTEGPAALVKHIERYDQLYFTAMLGHPHMVAIKDCLPNNPLYRPVVYEKGAITLHALRKVMGDDKFFELMHKYVADYADKPSVVNDFRKLASDVSGQDLSWFFAQWLDQTVYAHWTLSDVAVTPPAKPGDPFAIALRVQQLEDLVKMPVDITLIGESGQRQIIKDVMIDKYDQRVNMTAPFRPVKIILDEDNWVLKTPKADNIWPPEAAATAPSE